MADPASDPATDQESRAPYDPMPHGPAEVGVGPWPGEPPVVLLTLGPGTVPRADAHLGGTVRHRVVRRARLTRVLGVGPGTDIWTGLWAHSGKGRATGSGQAFPDTLSQ